jgi:hypothetical protein
VFAEVQVGGGVARRVELAAVTAMGTADGAGSGVSCVGSQAPSSTSVAIK